MQVLREKQLYAKFNKCDFFKDQIQYLGHVVSKEGISVDLDKVKIIMEWPIPKNVFDIRSFMGIIGQYWKFIQELSNISYLITSLQKKVKKFEWDEKCMETFNKLKNLLTTASIINIVDPFKDFFICTDACNEGLGKVLLQGNYVLDY